MHGVDVKGRTTYKLQADDKVRLGRYENYWTLNTDSSLTRCFSAGHAW